MKKLFLILLLIIKLTGIGGATTPTVNVLQTKDDPGEKGEILIHTGEVKKNQGVGTWVNVKEVPELRGEKGAKGDTGEKGEQGLQGIQGEAGVIPEEKLKEIDTNNIARINYAKQLNSHQSQLNNHESRIGNLERTQQVVEGNLRVLDTRKWEVSATTRYNCTRDTVDMVGVRVTFKIGKSYEEKRIDELEAKLKSFGVE